jgi:hypothetical protein
MSTLQYDADNIYYNITIKNTTSQALIANFNEPRVEPILENPRKYEMAVARFNFDVSNVPIFIWPSDTTFSVTFRYNNIDRTVNLVLPQNRDVNLYSKKAVWYVTDFTKAINNAFTAAYDYFDGLSPFDPANYYAPFILYSPNNGNNNLEIYVAMEFRDTLQIFFNRELYFYLKCFPLYIHTDPIKYAELILPDVGLLNYAEYKSVSSTFYPSQYNIIPAWNGVYSYLFNTAMPILSENNSGATAVTQRIITDFIPDQSENDSLIQYSPSVLRFYSFDTNKTLDQIDLKINWQDINGTIYPLYLEPGKFASIKLLFRKKAADIIDNR